MKLIHTADLHIGNARFARPGEPWSRLDDQARVLDTFVRAAAEHRVELAVIAGDLFDTRSPRPREWAVVTKFLSDLTEFCPVVIVDGNHDGAWVIGQDDSRTLQPLAQTAWANYVDVRIGPTVARPPGVGAVVVTVPYPHRRAAGIERGSDALAEGIRYLHQQAVELQQPGEPIIFVGHLSVAGAMLGSERSMRLEDDVTLSLDVLDLFDYGALGHIHLQQQASATAWYAGAPTYVDFGEAHHRKSFLLVDVAPGMAPVVETIPSGDHPMEVYDWTDGIPPFFGSMPDAIVRVLVSRGDERAARDALAGAYFLQLDVAAPEAVTLTERALPADTAPLDALRTHLTLTLPDIDVGPYLAQAEEYMA